HPPLLYMGYVGFSVAFAFAIAALLSGRLDSAFTRFARPWTLAEKNAEKFMSSKEQKTPEGQAPEEIIMDQHEEVEAVEPNDSAE
ncbi:hypothetical protein MJN76_33175, partial [Salmonella enterica subsp. enterica serovar Anatum]|nr:hypothetical protein [Salmonella enterica subsp. enterica serovar Anatum]